MRNTVILGVVFLCVSWASSAWGQLPFSRGPLAEQLYFDRARLGPVDAISQGPQLPVAGGVGTTAINVVPDGSPGSGGLGMTVDDVNSTVYCVDLFAGETNRYNLDLTLDIVIPNPAGTATTPGIAWVPDAANPDGGTLYWIVLAGADFDLYETNISGAVLGVTGGLVSPGEGLLGDFVYDDTRDAFVFNDIVADRYYTYDYNGLFWLDGSFANPDGGGIVGAFGNGIAYRDGTNCFDIQTGPASGIGVANLYRVDQIGTILDSATLATNIFTGGSAGEPGPITGFFTNGIAWHETGSGLAGPQPGGVLYAIEQVTDQLFEISTFDDCADCNHAQITSFTCTESGGIVEGTYFENALYDSIEVLRDGVPIANQPDPGDGGFTDDTGGSPGDSFSYEVRSTLGGNECPAGNCSIFLPVPGQIAVDHVGELPFGMTVIEDQDLVLVADLFSGDAFLYNRDLEIVNTLVSPYPAGTTVTGITWRPDTDELYWIGIADDPMTAPIEHEMIVTDTNAVFQNTFVVTTPDDGGAIGGLALNADQTGLIALDINFNLAFEMDFLGVLTGLEFPQIQGDVNGNGIAHLPDMTGYEIAGGSNADIEINNTFVARLTRVDEMGEQTGCIARVGPGNWIDDQFVNGFALTENGGPLALPGDFRYAVGNGTNRIYAEPVVCNPCLPLAGGTEGRFISDQTNVNASWDDTGDFASHDVIRDGEIIATLPGDTTSYSDPVVQIGEGLHTYVLRSTCQNGGFTEVFSEVFTFTVAPGTSDLVIEAEVQAPPATTDSAGAIFDELLAAGREPALVLGFVGNDLSAFDGVWYVGGTYPAVHVLNQLEFDTLADYMLSGTMSDPKAIYLERPMGWFEGEFEPFTDLDHVDPGLGGGVVDGILGQNSQLGLDLAGITATIDGENGAAPGVFGGLVGIAPDPDAGIGASAVWGNTAGGGPETTAVVGDSTVSGLGGGAVYKVLTSITEFGTYTPLATRTEVMANYIDFFFPFVPPPDDEFIRGDADGNGNFQGLVDGLFVLNFQFVQGSPAPPCMKAADANDDGAFSGLIDGLYILNFQFITGSPPPPPPYPACGEDPTVDSLECLMPPC